MADLDYTTHLKEQLELERAKVKQLQAEVRHLRKAVEAGVLPPGVRKWEPFVLGYLMERARHAPFVATRQEIAKACNCSMVTVDDAVRRLLGKDLIERVQRGVYQAKEPAA